MDGMGRGAFGVYKIWLRGSISSAGEGKSKRIVLPRTGYECQEGE